MSVVVPTYRRADLLRRALGALVHQRYPADRLEIIVVEDGGPGCARDIVEEFASRAVCEVRYLTVPHAGPAAARNAGWRAASGEVIAFTDDDTIPDPDWVNQGVRSIRCGADIVNGRTVVPLADRPSDAQRNAQGLERATLATCNAFCRRDWLVRVGGFDERFTRAYREDSDLEFSLRRAGARLESNQAAVVVHPPREEPWLVSLRQQRNQFFDALLYRKHPRMFRQQIRARPPLDYYTITIAQLMSFAAVSSGQRLVAALATLVWLPLVLRFTGRRLRGSRLDLAHATEMLLTSALIPAVAVFWRLRGASAFRVRFL